MTSVFHFMFSGGSSKKKKRRTLLFPSRRAGLHEGGSRRAGGRLLAGDERVPQDHDDRVPAQEHLGDVAVLVDGLGLLLALAALGDLSPHLLHVLQHHVAVPVKGLHAAQELLVVAAVDEHLGVVLDRLCEHGQRPRVKLLLLPLLQLLWRHLTLGLVEEAHGGGSSCRDRALQSPPSLVDISKRMRLRAQWQGFYSHLYTSLLYHRHSV